MYVYIHSVRMRENTDQKTPNTDTFHVVMRYQLERLERPHEKAGSVFHIHTLVILLLLFS